MHVSVMCLNNDYFNNHQLLNSRVLSGVHGDDIGLEQRSTALLAYYKGYHVFGCEYQV